PKRTILGRGIGWMAYNTARIEAGSPLFHVDFGPDSLPHETAILSQAVSFTKGCYLGQEIVARMQSLGHPKRLLVGLRLPDDRLPIAGSQVLTADGQVVGAVTSSTLSPLLGQTAIALAVVKWGRHEPGTTLRVAAEGAIVDARVVPPGQWR
ncbi:MAG: aminomethyltransferase family protein, partial [Phycisphaeraceae bacterium]|nr:aminomethyltransferase family protein [Phycisphaeraceae bacterium]